MANRIMACLMAYNFLSLRYEEDDWLAETIAKIIQEEAGPNNEFRNAWLEPSQAMKQADSRLRASLQEAITEMDEHEQTRSRL